MTRAGLFDPWLDKPRRPFFFNQQPRESSQGMSGNGQRLRFAALIRVSDKKQKERGESLRTQDTQTSQAVEQLGGTITVRYAGQEHATPGYERELLDEMLADAARPAPPFDAVIVANLDRWSPDNVRSETGLEHLKEHGCRFFVLTTEYDLYDKDKRLFLSLSTIFAGHSERVKKESSILNRLHRAKRGIPTAGGPLPYARTFDKATSQWGIDNELHEKIKYASSKILDGSPIKKVADEIGMEYTRLLRILTKASGDSWEVKYAPKGTKINEIVTHTIPRLLPEETIQAIRRRVEANKTFTHGQLRNKYLLGRMVFCHHCGSTMTGQTRPNGRQYYRHKKPTRTNPCPCPAGAIYAEDLDENVVRQLFEVFGNPVAVEQAIREATPELGKSEELRRRKEQITKDVEKIDRATSRILNQIQLDNITDEQATTKLIELKERQGEFRDELARIQDSLVNLRTPASIRAVSEEVAKTFRKALFPTRAHRRGIGLVEHVGRDGEGRFSARLWAKIDQADSKYEAMTWEDKRQLLQLVLGGKTPKGTRMGVYIEWINGEDSQAPQWRYSIRGQITREGWLPQSQSSLRDYYTDSEENEWFGYVNKIGSALSLPSTPMRGG